MLVSAFFMRVNYNLRGTDDDAPTTGTDDFTYWIDTLNRIKDELFGDATKRLDSCWDAKSVGTIAAAAAPSFALNATYLGESDVAYIIDSTGQRHEYDIVNPQDRDPKCRQVYVAGMNPQTLYFTNAIGVGEVIIGGTLYLPGFWMPADVTSGSETVPLPDPNWGAMKMAAELAFNDLTYEDKAPDLNNKANVMEGAMFRRLRMKGAKNPNRMRTRVRNRIRGFK